MFGGILHWKIPRTVMVCAACLALFAGIAWARVSLLDDARWIVLLLPAYLLRLRGRSWPALVMLMLICFGIGWWRGSAMMRQLAPYQEFSRRQVTVVGRAAQDGVYGTRYQMTFGLDHARIVSPVSASLPGGLSIAGFGAPAVYRGDVVQVSGKLYPTRGNDQASINFATLRVTQRNASWIDSFRRKFAAGMQSALPEPLAGFGLGLLIGQRNTLPADVSRTLLVVGLTHIIAVSGYNLTIIVNAARRMLSKRSKFQTAAACLFFIATFVLITGNSPSIVRAAIISVLSLLAWYYGRTIQPLTLLLTAGAISVLANPLYVWGNVSWYLSFLAFFGVLVLAPLVTARLYRGREPKLLGQVAIESLCAELMTLPYVLFIFGQMSLVGLLANVLVVALVPLAMLLCTVAGLAGMLLPGVAGWLAWPAKLLLTYMLDAASLLSRTPHAFVENIGFSLSALGAAYALVGFIWLMLRHGQRARDPP